MVQHPSGSKSLDIKLMLNSYLFIQRLRYLLIYLLFHQLQCKLFHWGIIQKYFEIITFTILWSNFQ